jgi:hypothetical protein
MASLTAVRAKHATLTTTTADDVTLSGVGTWVRVTNRSTGQPLTVIFGGSTAPTGLMDDSFVLDVNERRFFLRPGSPNQALVVRVVGSANPYSIELVDHTED